MGSDSPRFSADTLRAIEEWVIDDASGDYLDFWSIYWIVRRVAPSLDDDDVKQLALSSIAGLLGRGVLIAGELVPPGEFVAWGAPVPEILDLICRRVRALPGAPLPGDVAYFELSRDEGHSRGRS